ncbi:MAG: hypothetical protein KKC76_17110 [Proteobacteria bacterium]|nr:hypothetical protein [Pseudomonadota bacterium]MBU4294654.1 hypothetical protein [Pseudomonadota bacterium]MCG2748879.1 hypothetical protein [Desulfobulbaceae bacterium]
MKRDPLKEKGKKFYDLVLCSSEQVAALADKINLYISAKEQLMQGQ